MRLDGWLESWARWVHRGGVMTSTRSMLGVLIDNKGVMNYGQGGTKPLDEGSRESDIEAALLELAKTAPQDVMALRVEFGAVVPPNMRLAPRQEHKAHALGVSKRTYQMRLKRAKAYLVEVLAL